MVQLRNVHPKLGRQVVNCAGQASELVAYGWSTLVVRLGNGSTKIDRAEQLAHGTLASDLGTSELTGPQTVLEGIK